MPLARRIREAPRTAHGEREKSPETVRARSGGGVNHRQTYVTQRQNRYELLRKGAGIQPNCQQSYRSALAGSPAKHIGQDASSIPICGIEPASHRLTDLRSADEPLPK